MIGNLAGIWKFVEHTFQGIEILDVNQNIVIVLNGNGNFDVTIPVLNKPGPTVLKDFPDLPLVLDEKLRPTLFHTWVDGAFEYGLRLVFDIVGSNIEIVEGALGSTIERWNLSENPGAAKIAQPSDMGVITGGKG